MNQKIEILLVQDNNADTDLMKFMLLKQNARNISFQKINKLSEIDNYLSNNIADIVILDTEVSDYKSAQDYLSITQKYPDIPLILISTKKCLNLMVESLNKGVQDYLIKGEFEGDALIRTIYHSLERNRLISKINKQKRIIEESEYKFKSIANTAKDAIIHLDNEGKIIFWNPVATQIFQYEEQEVIGKDLHKLLAPSNYHHSIEKGMKNYKKTGQGTNIGTVREFIAIKKDGRKFPVEISFSAFKIEDKWHSAGIIRDITYRKEHEKKLLDTQKKLSSALNTLKTNHNKLAEINQLKSVQELAAGVSHEFSQPLQALSNYLTIIRETGVEEIYLDKCFEMLDKIAALNIHLRNITNLKKRDYVDTQILDLKASSNSEKKQTAKRVLVVDDEVEILDTMVEMLNLRGYQCDGADNGNDGLEMVKINHYDIIISDVMMPNMSGPEFFQNVKKIKNTSIFFFLTGYEIPVSERSIIEQADGVFTKPVSFDNFLTSIENASDKKMQISRN